MLYIAVSRSQFSYLWCSYVTVLIIMPSVAIAAWYLTSKLFFVSRFLPERTSHSPIVEAHDTVRYLWTLLKPSALGRHRKLLCNSPCFLSYHRRSSWVIFSLSEPKSLRQVPSPTPLTQFLLVMSLYIALDCLTHPFFSRGMRNCIWADSKGKQELYAIAVSMWSLYPNFPPDANSNKIPKNRRGMTLRAQRYDRAVDLCR